MLYTRALAINGLGNYWSGTQKLLSLCEYHAIMYDAGD